MMSWFGAKRLGLLLSRPVAARKKVTWKPSGFFSGVSTHPVTYHHSVRKVGWAPKSRGNDRRTPGTTAENFGCAGDEASGGAAQEAAMKTSDRDSGRKTILPAT